MKILRTPDEQFTNLPDYAFEPNYLEIPSGTGESLRIHYVDEGPREAAPVLLLHGEPTWSYLYRKMIPPLVAAGHRVIAPDLVGFGRSDKPSEVADYTYQRHMDWLHAVVDGLQIKNISLFCQDWGGLLGLRLVAERPDDFARVVAANTFLPTGDRHPGDAFLQWQKLSQEIPVFETGKLIRGACARHVPDDVRDAYDAPFPEEHYKAAARAFPMLVPTSPDNPASPANRKAWEVLQEFNKPFLCAFSDSDPITRGGEKVLQKLIPGCEGQPHTTIENAGHFLQEDAGEELARVINDFIARTS